MLGLATQIPLAAIDIAREARSAFDTHTHRDHALIASTPLTTDGVPVQARLGAVHGSDDHCLATCLAVPGCNVVTRLRPDAPCLLDWGASCATGAHARLGRGNATTVAGAVSMVSRACRPRPQWAALSYRAVPHGGDDVDTVHTPNAERCRARCVGLTQVFTADLHAPSCKTWFKVK